MSDKISDYPLVIIGAGAAGLGASEAASANNIKHVVLEASHRTGGRGLTEYLEGKIPVDLGCHWMHSASLNPYVEWAETLGFDFETDPYKYSIHQNGSWLNGDKTREYDTFVDQSYSNIFNLYEKLPESPIIDALDVENEFTQYFCYLITLMHSADVDQVSVRDVVEYKDTYENWPLQKGYGALISKQGENCPVQLNSEARKIKWDGQRIKVTTNNGGVTAEKLILTVSTGVLDYDQIEFFPKLPVEKLEAINTLPLGNANYQFFTFEKNCFANDTPDNIQYDCGDISMGIRFHPFGTPCLFTSTGGRFAWWLEKQGPKASEDYLRTCLTNIFGCDIQKKLREFKVSAWGFDPYIRGAYSYLKPGYTGMRQKLSEPLNESLYFAGEATSVEFFATAHGAYFSGKRAVEETIRLAS